ncbi:L-glutamate ABC transporter membrane protein /L-aspartate ABC transporter membrane protein [Orbus hercynius]|uniref:L-glutamate ABC transporter membrane protein /L-aspartate ABC transporter membrane protein n=1 Tax=Orbus hercynius TaxID=593135 RepID=A0A495RHV3_9GAMM|nr:amino acid ABC transporter permease [Orbus hercynius]RKS87097.1 L-glutamate ABC transporter membrane protein /L-aspartate ABC transporter membrane protein [Orbus hercynius]
MNFNWTLFFEPTPYGDGIYLNWLLSGLTVTLSLAISAWIIAFIFGSIVGIMRTSNSKFLRKFAIYYVDIFRNIPLLVQMFLWYTLLPQILSGSLKVWFMEDLDPNIQCFVLAMVALGLFTSARIAEQVRTGIQTLPVGQKYAATALGLTQVQTYYHILLPNAYRKIIPTLTSEMTNIIKNSSVASTIGLLDLTGQIDRINEQTNSIVEILCGVTLAFAIVNYAVILIMRRVEKKTRLPNMMSGG